MPAPGTRVLLAAAIAAGALLGGCGSSGTTASPGEARGIVDELRGSYDGVALGEPLAAARRRLGPPLGGHSDGFLTTAQAPPYLPADSPADVVYPDVDLTSVAGRVASFTVYGLGAGTGRGIGLGDALDGVRTAYRHVRCVRARAGANPRDAGCEAQTAPGVHLYVGGSPIKVIVLSSRPVIP